MKNYIFILAGGSGTRLAPLSLTSPGKLPKQFLALVGQKTMLQETIERIPLGNEVIIIPEKQYEAEVKKQAGTNCAVLPEPFGCNTAPAIGLAAFYALDKTKDENTVLFFMPADHIMEKDVFQKYFELGIAKAQETGKIITIGITPDRPETGYGYIKVKNKTAVAPVEGFVEKPDLSTAEKYLAEGNYFWNAGIFCMTIKTILNALQKDAPDIYTALQKIDLHGDLQAEIIREYTALKTQKKNISIDYAVMEKEADNMLLLRAGEELAWNDVGGWVALARYNQPDKHNNLVFNYLRKELKLENCQDLLLVISANGILVTTQTFGQRAKEIIPGILAGKPTEQIDCLNTTIKNTTTLYVGALGLKNCRIVYDGEKLMVEA
jgi:mannose-1-phosphate guanylyltransferase/mannose-6-phosphate isomerase